MTEIVLEKHVTWEIGGPVSRSLAYWSFITWGFAIIALRYYLGCPVWALFGVDRASHMCN